MVEGTDKVQDHLSCGNSSYGECNLEVNDSGDSIDSGSKDEEYGSGNTDALGKEPYQFKLTGTDWTTLRLCILLLLVPKMILTLSNLCWCSFSVDPICICTRANEHALQLAHCGGCCIYVVVIVGSVPCVCVCVCVCLCVCVCVCVVWCIFIHNCLASCCAPIRGCVRTSSPYAHTSSGRESRRVLLDRFVSIRDSH